MKIEDYYNSYDEENRLLSRYGMAEFVTTMYYIEKYTTPDSRIIEIGAGTERYSHALAKKGYCVDAVELVKHNIEIFKGKITPEENITICQGNATDLSDFKDNQYDITLLPVKGQICSEYHITHLIYSERNNVYVRNKKNQTKRNRRSTQSCT